MDVMLEQPKVELDLDGWTDISSYVKYENRISISRGRSSEGSRGLEQSTCAMTLLNHDGRFSPRNPTSPYYGVLGRNTPIRVSLAAPDSYLDLTAAQARSVLVTAGAGGINVTDLDVRIDLWSDQWQSGSLCGRWNYLDTDGFYTASEASWGLMIEDGGVPVLQWSEDGFNDTVHRVRATEPLPVTCGRMAVRATLDADNGASGHTVTFYTSDTISGSWTQLGDAVVTSGTTTVYSSDGTICVGYVPAMDRAELEFDLGDVADQVPGHYYAFELRSGIGGTEMASPSWTGLSGTEEDDDSLADDQGNTWESTPTGGRTTDRLWRFWGEVSEWPPKSDISGTDVTVSITASGPTRRIVQGSEPLHSAMHQMYTGTSGYVPHGEDNSDAYKGIIAYWPMEDGKEATQLEGIGDLVRPGLVTGTPSLASYGNWTASDPLPQMDTGTFTFTVPSYDPDEFVAILEADSYTSIHMFVFAATPAVSAETSLMRIRVSGGISGFDVRLTTGGDLRVRAYDSDGVSVEDTTVDANVYSRGFFILEFNIIDEGLGSVTWELNVLDFTNTDLITTEPDGVSDGNSFTGTVGRVTRIIVGDDQGLGTTYVGHLAVSNNPNVLATATPLPPEVAAFNGEKPLRRISRLVGSQGLSTTPVSTHADDDPVSMGDQLARPWSDLVTEAAESDQGILYEMKDRPGVGYRCRSSLYGQSPALTLDHSAHELSQSLAPTDDDQHLVNEIAVTREAGSTFHAEATDGPLGIDIVGRAPGTQSLSLSSDTQLRDQAGWRLHLGTVDEARQPTVQVNLAHSSFTSDKRLEALRTDIGGRILITDPPDWLPPEDISQLVQGYTEVIDQFQHVITFNCAPESPYHVGQVDVDGYDRLDSAGATLASAVTTTETSLSVSHSTLYTSGSGTWTAPAEVTSAQVECWGGGGGGGASSSAGWSGGGGGEYASEVVSVTPGTGYAYSVGSGGAGASGPPSSFLGGTGGSSTFGGTLVVAHGGTGGFGATGGAGGTGSSNTTHYNGGSGGDGAEGIDFSSSGGGGGSGGTASAGNDGADGTISGDGAGGAAVTGGGAGGTGFGVAGSAPGGGGGGAGDGARGMIRITYAAGGELWTTDGSDTPFDVMVAGERMTVTTVGEVLNTNPYFESGITGWSAFQCTIAHSTSVVHPDGTGSLEITPDGVNSVGAAGSATTGAGSITPGASYEAMLWAYSPTGGITVQTLVNWAQSDGTLISSDLGQAVTLEAGEWTHLQDTQTAPALASQATVWGWHSGTPSISDVWYVYAVKLIPANDTSPQTLTVTRSVNGVVKAQSSGAEVHIADPVYVAL